MQPADATKNTIGKALGRIPSGLFILTAGTGDQAGAMLASWVQQAGFQPPLLTVAIAADRPLVPIIRQEGHFVLSVVAEHEMALMKRFVRGVPPGPEALAGVNHRPSGAGVPILTDALAYMECRLKQICDLEADHLLMVGEVIDGAILREGASFTHLRGNGFRY
ncbi:MAG: flavin reductase family protein [Phycisphaerales bacterium]|jgi:flavin reductase (DIM6/NTAB) family NADH-FMN oxidoreductase RutF|nr:flavin reductase family protein [Phycisphaerales bacterium]